MEVHVKNTSESGHPRCIVCLFEQFIWASDAKRMDIDEGSGER